MGPTKVRKRAKIRNRYNQEPHLAQDTISKVTTSQLDFITESQEVSPFPAGGHKTVCLNDDPKMTLTNLTSRSDLLSMHLNGIFFEKLIFLILWMPKSLFLLDVQSNETLAINTSQRSALTLIF